MEEQRECDKTANHIHCFYFVKIRPSCLDVIKETEEQYTLARNRINEEIAKQKAVEHEITQKIEWFAWLDERIASIMYRIKYFEQWDPRILNKCYMPNSNIVQVQITNGFFRLYGKGAYGKDMYGKPLYDTDDRSDVRPDRKRCKKKLIKKGEMDAEYIEQVQDELMTSKKSSVRPISGGTRQLNDLIESMARRIQHGSEKWAHEMKIYQEIKTVNETREFYNAPEPPNCYRQGESTLKEGDLKGDIDVKLSRQHEINIRLNEMENLKAHLKGRKSRVTRLKANLELLRKNISSLNKELENVTSKEDEAYKRANKLRDQTKEMKSSYDEYQSIMKNAVEELVRKGYVVGLKRLSNNQVEDFMKQWCESKGFRDDYERRKLAFKSQ